MILSFLWGIDKKILSDFSQQAGHCPKCSQDAVFAHVYQRYQHLLGLPLYPTNRVFKVRCRSCGTHYYGEAIPPQVHEHIRRQSKKAGTPVYLYLGALLVPATILSILLFLY